MKIFWIWLSAFLLYSCTGTKYFLAADSIIPADAEEYLIDSTSELFVRQVYRHFNVAENRWELTNDRLSDSESVVEKEFLILSKRNNQVLIINNVPSSYQKLYEKSQSLLVERKSVSSTVEMNAKYFRQFRFGEKTSSSTINFIPTDDEASTHTWNIKFDKDIISLTSISVGDASETRVRYIQPAVKINIIYSRVPRFSLVFNRETEKGELIETIALLENKILIKKDGAKWYVYMQFKKPVDGSVFSSIYFRDRVYARFP